ncbi:MULTISPECIES: S24 family peptidase [Limnobaculum]|uniref:S24 family peptidase n=1 Tax=Limnobaculum TaxID=2172100 RepID=UPI0038994E94
MRSGDVVAIDTNNTTIESGHLYAVQEAGLIRVRKLHIMKDVGVCVECFNCSEYPLEGLTYVDFNERFTVIGRVFWSSRLW